MIFTFFTQVGPVGNCVNVAWATGGVKDGDYLAAWHRLILPVATEFRPSIAIISAGFDAAIGDPLGGCRVSPAGYAQMTAMTMSLCAGRVMLLLEGGYNLLSIATSAEACVNTLLGDPPEMPANVMPSKSGTSLISLNLKLTLTLILIHNINIRPLRYCSGHSCSQAALEVPHRDEP